MLLAAAKAMPKVELHLLKVGACRAVERLAVTCGQLRVVDFPAIVALILHPKHGPILWDTGYSNQFFEVTRRLPERFYRWATPVSLPSAEQLSHQLARFSLSPMDIRTCIISHFHADHISGLRDLPQSGFVCMRRDYEYFSTLSGMSGVMKGFLPALLPENFLERARFAEDGKSAQSATDNDISGFYYDLFEDGSLLGVPLPGHSPGQLGLLLRDAVCDKLVFLCADACWLARGFQVPSLPSVFTYSLVHSKVDTRNLVHQLHSLSKANQDLHIQPSHCQESYEEFGSQRASKLEESG